MNENISLLTKYGLNLGQTDNLLLAFFSIFILYIFLGELFERIGINELIGQITAGIILGGSLLNFVNSELIEPFAIIGSILILFTAGINKKTDKFDLKDSKSLAIGVIVLLSTFAVMLYVFNLFFNFQQSLFLALAYSVVDIFVPLKLLSSKKLLSKRFAQSFINMSMSNILIGLLILSAASVFLNQSSSELIFKLIFSTIFVILIYYFIISINKITDKINKFKSSTREESQITLTFILLFLLAFLSELIGLSVIIGAFIAGIVISKSNFAKKKLYTNKIEAISNGFFIPLFFVWFGLNLNLILIYEYLSIAILFIFASIFTKFVVTYILSKNFSLKAPGTIASSMLSLDVESLIIILAAINLGIFSNYDTFDIFAPAVPITTLLVTLMTSYFIKKEYRQISLT